MTWENPEETVLAQRRPQQIVEQHVKANVTGLVSTLATEYIDDDAIWLMYGDDGADDGAGDYCAYEVWQVSEWLARQLDNHDQRTSKLWGQWYWARGATGQAIRMDSIIEEIAGNT